MNQLARATCCLTLLLLTTPGSSAELLFYASFDKGPDADFARGNKQAGRRGQFPGRSPQTVAPSFERSLDLTNRTKTQLLTFHPAANFDIQRGTIEFFAYVNKVKGRRPTHQFFNLAGAQSFHLGLGSRPNGQGSVLGFSFDRQAGWYYYSERFVANDKWQHYAVTWDMTGGKGKGRIAIYVDGVRRVEAKKLNPMQWAPERLYLGGTNSWGYIDDFAIYNDVLYSKNFVPRKQPLARLVDLTKLRNNKVDVTKSVLGHPSLHNGGFEDWVGGRPVGWKLQRGVVRAEQVMRMNGRRSLAILVDRNEQHPWPHSLLTSDPFVLEPNSQYRLRLWVASPATVGDLRFEVSATDGGLLTSYRSGWTREHPWLQVNQTFRTRDSQQHTMTIAAQSGFGWPVWIDGITIEKLGGATVPAGGKAGKGFQLFSRSIMESLNVSQQLPQPSERIDAVTLRLSRGEFEPTLVGLHATRAIRNVDLRLTKQLTGSKGAVLPSQSIIVRRLQGALLPKSRPRSVQRGDIIAWWVTVRSRKSTRAGIYRGELSVMAGGKELQRLPFLVEIMDVVLPQPKIAYLMYHHEHYFARKFLTPQLQQMYYRDMRDHGMNTVTVYNNGDADGTKNVNFSKNYGYDKDHPQFNVGLDTQMKWIRAAGLCRTGQPVLWLPSRSSKHGGKGYGWGGLPKPALQQSLKEWATRKWPEPLLYAHDEPGGKGPRAEAAKARLRDIKSWRLPVRTTTAGLDPEALGRYYDVWIEGDGGVSVKSVRLAKELKAELWTYNCTCNHRNMPFSRAFFGFWAYRTGLKGVAQWAYYDNVHWSADAEGNAGGNPRTRLSRVCPSPTGPIPTLAWEATREGIDDYRYAQWLAELRKRARQQLTRLNELVDQSLTKQDRETIVRREQQKIGQVKPRAKKIVWVAKTAQQLMAEGKFLAARKLERVLRDADQAMEYAIYAIPFDAMKTRMYLSYHAPRWTNFCPPLGPAGLGENPRTATEVRRKMLISYIQSLQIAIARASTAGS